MTKALAKALYLVCQRYALVFGDKVPVTSDHLPHLLRIRFAEETVWERGEDGEWRVCEPGDGRQI